jgi:hypothetical protein
LGTITSKKIHHFRNPRRYDRRTGGVLLPDERGISICSNTGTRFWAPQAYLLAASYGVAFALYWIVRAIRTRQGIPIDLAFKALPPE